MFDTMAIPHLLSTQQGDNASIADQVQTLPAGASSPGQPLPGAQAHRQAYLDEQAKRIGNLVEWDKQQSTEALKAASKALIEKHEAWSEAARASAWLSLHSEAEYLATKRPSKSIKRDDSVAAPSPRMQAKAKTTAARSRSSKSNGTATPAASAGLAESASEGASAKANGEKETLSRSRRKRKAEDDLGPRGKLRNLAPAKNGEDGSRQSSVESESRDEADETVDGDAAHSKSSISVIKGTPKQYQTAYEGIWRDIARKDLPKAYKIYQTALNIKQSNTRKTAALASREARRWQIKTNKQVKDLQSKARRAMREMLAFWKRNEREERDQRKKAEKEALESVRRLEEEREARRQARKLNFLITQTELYSHFVGDKLKTSEVEGDEGSSGTLTPATDARAASETPNGMVKASSLDFDEADDENLSMVAQQNAQQAVMAARARAQEFDGNSVRKVDLDESEMNFQNPTSLGDLTIAQPKLLSCQLKEYQLKGLNWLANLYEQGINGILADEMGLGKTVQSISAMAYLAETHNIWGPYLVIAPASTLHNWQQEITKFVPEFKVLPYWGNNKDRKVLRKFWDRKKLRYTKDSPFHVLVTSYQLVVADAQYFNRVKWQYMILDEAQAIKSSSSSRWKSLLAMQCRNRLLLTGTPIQNSMQELWALLHFIMPTLFDSHEEFSDWFSKDIESHATKNSQLNEEQLKRLHMILKPFMLRRVKKHVQQELGDKIEIDVYCDLTHRQRVMYQMLKSQISIKDLIERTANEDTQSLMNLVMQFRKVCNHPDLFQRADVESAFAFGSFGSTTDFAREGAQLDLCYTQRNPIKFESPKFLYRQNLESKTSIERMLTVWEPQNPTIKAVSALTGSTASRICEEARKGLLNRALGLYELSPEEKKQQELFTVVSDSLDSSYLMVYERAYQNRVIAPPIEYFVSDRSHVYSNNAELFPVEQKSLFALTLNQEWALLKQGAPFPPSNLLPPNVKSQITIPSMARFVSDSGKLNRLDSLLAELKANDHRVLIYFQMTKMMDLMEEYLTYRQYNYVRLDGSSKLGDRRDLVNDWQAKPDLFVFLLSTRAGGLGINLTAADTVIFYDSDWNPTIDSQAMDRAHRLGQTRQVTVYRLLVRGTIEERMRDRAKQKEHVQQVVMEGGRGENADFQKPGREVAYWLLDDEEASQAIQRQEDLANAKPKKRGKQKAASAVKSLEEMYHEQEGNFENA